MRWPRVKSKTCRTLPPPPRGLELDTPASKYWICTNTGTSYVSTKDTSLMDRLSAHVDPNSNFYSFGHCCCRCLCYCIILYLFYYSKNFYYCCAFYTLVCKALCWKCAVYKTPRTLTPVTFNWRFRCYSSQFRWRKPGFLVWSGILCPTTGSNQHFQFNVALASETFNSLESSGDISQCLIHFIHFNSLLPKQTKFNLLIWTRQNFSPLAALSLQR